jgi:hypothetical protein
MQRRIWIVGFLTGSLGAVLAPGCYSSGSEPPPVTTDASCTADASLQAQLTLDAGPPACQTCINTTCASTLSACSGDCTCSSMVAGALQCIGSLGGNASVSAIGQCVSGLTGSSDDGLTQLATCLTSCGPQCGAAAADGPCPGADATVSSYLAGDSGACGACVQTMCTAAVAACTSDCSCNAGIETALQCLANLGQNASIESAAACLATVQGDAAVGLGTCIEQDCPSQCGLASPSEAGEAGETVEATAEGQAPEAGEPDAQGLEAGVDALADAAVDAPLAPDAQADAQADAGSCTTGQTLCSQTTGDYYDSGTTYYCVDLTSSNANCGGCNAACPTWTTCSASTCTCNPGAINANLVLGTLGGIATATDVSTGLVWQLDDAPMTYNWSGAAAYCTGLGAGWTLPTDTQLQGLYQDGEPYRGCPLTWTGTDAAYWSSTPIAGYANYAYAVEFGIGGETSNEATVASHSVRCVYVPAPSDAGDAGGAPLTCTGAPLSGFTVGTLGSVATVTDPTTGLVWQQASSPPLALADLTGYCSLLGPGWSSPTQQQLQSLKTDGAGWGSCPFAWQVPCNNLNCWTYLGVPGASLDFFYDTNDRGVIGSGTTYEERCVYQADAGAAPPPPPLDAGYYVYDASDGSACTSPAGFTVNGDGTVTDLTTGLVWQAASSDQAYDEALASEYCSSLGGTWTLPTSAELVALYNDLESHYLYFPASCPFTWDAACYGADPCHYYWSSTTGYSVDMDYGSTYGSFAATTQLGVRCVRQ